MPALRGILVSLITCALAADQSPPTAFALTQQYRPDTKWRSCKSTGNVRTNCGFCYSRSGSFQGWNCNCDKFCTGTANDCYYIMESDPSNYAQVTCQGATVPAS
ncbi:hypothetical protein CERZMDRAFT_94577 [Cercospora zeae-maydis SCOH1-5]|uniref:Uncharacterized protein n=1 Tax=Cercospora zeae-maydis SCOH1-5 TaxID=717836 RepID=A0A6A6FNY1_9PEZI|nr:hypothetical protein CERZMDRAFT_94577 [Cercospora zeae-maydis SCOH1-5]